MKRWIVVWFIWGFLFAGLLILLGWSLGTQKFESTYYLVNKEIEGVEVHDCMAFEDGWCCAYVGERCAIDCDFYDGKKSVRFFDCTEILGGSCDGNGAGENFGDETL